MDGINEGYSDFLEVIDYEGFANIMGCLDSACGVGLVALFAMKMDADLVLLGLVMLLSSCFFFFLVIAVSLCQGWTRLVQFLVFLLLPCSRHQNS